MRKIFSLKTGAKKENTQKKRSSEIGSSFLLLPTLHAFRTCKKELLLCMHIQYMYVCMYVRIVGTYVWVHLRDICTLKNSWMNSRAAAWAARSCCRSFCFAPRKLLYTEPRCEGSRSTIHIQCFLIWMNEWSFSCSCMMIEWTTGTIRYEAVAVVSLTFLAHVWLTEHKGVCHWTVRA